jgi:hypothetical protein
MPLAQLTSFRLLLVICFVAVVLNQIVKQGKGAEHNEERECKAVKWVPPELYLPAIQTPMPSNMLVFQCVRRTTMIFPTTGARFAVSSSGC